MSRPYKSICAYCGHVHQRATAVQSATDALAEEPKMRPGDATMCVGCGSFNIVADDGKLRVPNAREQWALDHDPLAQIVRDAFQRVRPPLN